MVFSQLGELFSCVRACVCVCVCKSIRWLEVPKGKRKKWQSNSVSGCHFAFFMAIFQDFRRSGDPSARSFQNVFLLFFPFPGFFRYICMQKISGVMAAPHTHAHALGLLDNFRIFMPRADVLYYLLYFGLLIPSRFLFLGRFFKSSFSNVSCCSSSAPLLLLLLLLAAGSLLSRSRTRPLSLARDLFFTF